MIRIARIRNPKGKTAKATKALQAIKRKVLALTAYKEKVLIEAVEKGKWMADYDGKYLRPSVVALKDRVVRLSVKPYWNKSPRIDWKNVYGLVEDALFAEDRFVKPGKRSDVAWDTGEGKERVQVWLEFPVEVKPDIESSETGDND